MIKSMLQLSLFMLKLEKQDQVAQWAGGMVSSEQSGCKE